MWACEANSVQSWNYFNDRLTILRHITGRWFCVHSCVSMGVQTFPFRLLAVARLPPPETCGVFPFIHASVIMSVLAFILSIPAPTPLFPMVAGQMLERLLSRHIHGFGRDRLL